MAYDERLAERMRAILATHGPDERKMFGGLAFMVRGHMTVGVLADDLMVRVGPDAYDEALTQPHTRPMDFTGRPMRGLVYVGPGGTGDDDSLAAWVERGLAYTMSLPAK